MLLNSYAKALIGNGNYEKAFKIIEMAIKIKPESITEYTHTFVINRNYDTAALLFERAMQINKNDIFTINKYADAALSQGDYEKAFDL